jgi:AmpD protein
MPLILSDKPKSRTNKSLMKPLTIDNTGICAQATQIASPNFDARPDGSTATLIVVHNISLPPQQYGGNGIIELFTNQLNPDEHPYYAEISHLKVSSHFLIRRDGVLIQFVSCIDRAWHAGASQWQGRERCNDFSIGIELEGSDFEAFEAAQYHTLNQLIASLKAQYNIEAVTGHSDIAPGRKTDPGPFFDWSLICQQP